MNSEDAADLSLLPRSSRGSLRTDEGATGADLLGNGTFSNDGHSLMSARSGRTDATADHYTSEPRKLAVHIPFALQTDPRQTANS